MLDHVSIGVKDIASAKKFYDAAFKPLGYVAKYAGDTDIGYGKDEIRFWLNKSDSPVKDDPLS